MRLRILDVRATHDSDSDFDTAVDIRHWSMFGQTLLLESPGGVRFLIQAVHESTTYTYVEPDFDLLEKTGHTVWQTYAYVSRDTPWTVRRSFDGLYIARPAEPVTVEELQAAQRKHGNDPWAIDDDVDLPHALRVRLIAHLQGGDGRPSTANEHHGEGEPVAPYRFAVQFETADIERLSELEGRKGLSVDVALSPALEGSILAAEKLHATITAANDAIVSANRARAAHARLGILIDELADKARRELARLFASTRH